MLTSSKLAIGSAAAAFLVGGGVAVESTGLGYDVRHSMGLNAGVESEVGAQSSLETAFRTELSGKTEADVATDAKVDGGIETGIGSDIAISIGLNAGDTALDVQSSLDLVTDLRLSGNDMQPFEVSASGNGSQSASGAARGPRTSTLLSDVAGTANAGLDTTADSAVQASAGVAAQATAGGGSTRPTTEAQADTSVEVGVSYAALLDRARQTLRSIGGQACTSASVTAMVSAMGPVDATLAERAVLEACAEAQLADNLPAVPTGAESEGSVGGGLSLN